MSLLSGKAAATMADGVYNITQYSTTSAVQARTDRDIQQATGVGGTDVGVSARAGLVGRSGAFIKETTGFGMVLDRGPSANRELIVVLRGTQTTPDWLSNFNIGYDAGPSGCLVHSGFNRIYKSFADDLRAAIDRAQAQTIHFVGHSLGGALATIAASEFSSKKKCYLYTFGAPRVGSIGLTSDLRARLPESHVRRAYAISDPVPMIPLLPFCHFMPGSVGLNAGFGKITADAHSMTGCYIPNMPAQGWPAQQVMPVRSDVSYWLDRAEQANGIGSSFGYYCLSAALAGLMGVLNLLGIGIGVGLTLLDRLVEALRSAVLISKEFASLTFRFVKAALKIVGRGAIATATTAADLTRQFLRFVFELLLQPVKIAAQAAQRFMQ